MRSTIGEIANIILPFTSMIQISESANRPFLKANIMSGNHFLKFTLYVTQIAEHEYAIIDTNNDINGYHYFANSSISRPFIIEQDMIRSQFSENFHWYDRVVSHLDSTTFFQHFLNLLYEYQIISYKTESNDIVLEYMEINSPKIRRAVKKAFKERGVATNGTIWNLIEIMYEKEETFWLRGLTDREASVIVAKLKSIGLQTTIDRDLLTTLQFIRR